MTRNTQQIAHQDQFNYFAFIVVVLYRAIHHHCFHGGVLIYACGQAVARTNNVHQTSPGSPRGRPPRC